MIAKRTVKNDKKAKKTNFEKFKMQAHMWYYEKQSQE